LTIPTIETIKTIRTIETMKNRMLRLLLPIAVALLAAAPVTPARAAIKVLSFAINEANSSADKQPIQDYMGQNDVDFGVFDFAKASTYFVNDDFTSEGRNFKAAWYQNGNVDYKFILYSDRYELVNVPNDDKSGNNITAVFKDEYGDQFALISLRGTYKDDKVSATLGPVKTYIDGIATKYPGAKIIVTYNARLSGTYATTGNAYRDILDTYLTETSSGPQMTCLGRVQDVGIPRSAWSSSTTGTEPACRRTSCSPASPSRRRPFPDARATRSPDGTTPPPTSLPSRRPSRQRPNTRSTPPRFSSVATRRTSERPIPPTAR